MGPNVDLMGFNTLVSLTAEQHLYTRSFGSFEIIIDFFYLMVQIIEKCYREVL
jgi:hypothetical protein